MSWLLVSVQHPCVLRFIPLDNIQGLHPLSLVIADFENDTSFVPLSVVTLKLVVDVVHGVGGQCTAHVAFVNPTLTDGTCIGIEPNSTFKTTIYVKEDPCSWYSYSVSHPSLADFYYYCF